ncbi:MAG: 50S ribosomal protein L23 [Chthoniobacteraceae bacterium]
MNEPFDIIDTVRLTEKGSVLTEKHNQYVFRVAPHANKIQIKHAIEKLFGKKVVRVNTSNVSGKAKRQRTAAYGKTSDWKKAIVTLKEGEKIDLA